MILTPRSKAVIIILDVCERHKVLAADLKGPSRKLFIVHARWELAYRLRHELQWSFPKIGLLLNKDHSSIIHAVKECGLRGGLMSVEPKIRPKKWHKPRPTKEIKEIWAHMEDGQCQ